MPKYNLVDYDQLKEGDPVIGFANYVLRWDLETMGTPKWGVVEAEETPPAPTSVNQYKRVCVDCMRFYRVEKVGIVINEEIFDPQTGESRHYRTWNADLHVCPKCGHKIAVLASQPSYDGPAETPYKVI